MTRSRTRTTRWLYPYRMVRARLRLFGSIALGAICFLLLWDAPLALRFCLAWDLAVICYLALFGLVVATTGPHDIRRHAREHDEGRIGILVLAATAAMAVLAAIFLQLGGPAGGDARLVLMLIATTLLSWTFTHTIFAIHYAHEYYDEPPHDGGLQFPGEEPPDYWDFIYFAFVIGMTSQVSDVAITQRAIRRTAIAHGIVSFIFNTALLAITINIAAGKVSAG
jgi:uncharacterized membrane protein